MIHILRSWNRLRNKSFRYMRDKKKKKHDCNRPCDYLFSGTVEIFTIMISRARISIKSSKKRKKCVSK